MAVISCGGLASGFGLGFQGSGTGRRCNFWSEDVEVSDHHVDTYVLMNQVLGLTVLGL